MQNFFLCNAPGFEIFLEILVVKKHRHIQSIKLHMDLGYSFWEIAHGFGKLKHGYSYCALKPSHLNSNQTEMVLLNLPLFQ